jgi:phage N-6-adenine-methyltransferase
MSTFTGWRTPRELFEPIALSVGGFAIDAAADSGNTLLPRWYGPGSELGEDALAVEEWLSPAFCNPPYGKGIEVWLRKFQEQARKGVSVVALLPARVETRWWYELVVPFADILFLVGRVPFERGCDQCSVATATRMFIIEAGQKWFLCDTCAPQYAADWEDTSEPYSTQPDHASAVVIYSPQSAGRVGWLDWKKHLKEEALPIAA